MTYSCDAGFTRVGPEGSVCLNTGEWSPKQPPVCQGLYTVYWVREGMLSNNVDLQYTHGNCM